MVRPRASRPRLAEGGGLRPDRDHARRHRQCAAGRGARLLSDRGAATADPAGEGKSHRGRRHRHRRHMPEIEQGLSAAAGKPITVSFTPHLMPMNRGLLSTIYVRYAKGAKLADLRAALEKAYKGEAFVRVLPDGSVPATQHVRGSNLCLIGLAQDRLSDRAILVSAIDNLVKGASGQAVQDMNVMLGLDETAGLAQQPLFP